MIVARLVECGRSALNNHVLSAPPNHHPFHSSTTTIYNIGHGSPILKHSPHKRRTFTNLTPSWTHSHRDEQGLGSSSPSSALDRQRTTTHKSGPLNVEQNMAAGSATGTLEYYRKSLAVLLAALRRNDVLTMYFSLMHLCRGIDTESGNHAFAEVIVAIPAITFSEILRAFDPNRVSSEVDTAPGICISYGMAVHTALGELINKWGVKLLYVRILHRLRRMQATRRQWQICPLLNDYLVLMRYAGATSDPQMAKEYWRAMENDGYQTWRHPEAFSELIKARYLTENLYANNDLARFRLRPLDLHRSGIYLPGPERRKLHCLQSSMTDLQYHRFGHNINERYYAEPLTRILRKRSPLLRLARSAKQRGMIRRMAALECALLKAHARCGRLRASKALLRNYLGIQIKTDKETGATEISGGVDYPPHSPNAPTEALLDAVVHCYGSMGELSLAARLIHFISQRFSIPVPGTVWSDLLDYAHIMQSKPASTEWEIARFHYKMPKRNTVLNVWEFCTQEPYNFQPGLKDHFNLIKSLIQRRGSMRRPIAALRAVKTLYAEASRACGDAWCELVQTTRQGVPNHSAYRHYRLLQARKEHVWYCFHYSMNLILKNIRPNRVDDDYGVREIPKLIGDFAQFLPRHVKYELATGIVEFPSDNINRLNVADMKQVVEIPRPLRERPPYKHQDEDEKELREDQEDDMSWDVIKDNLPTIWEDMGIGEQSSDLTPDGRRYAPAKVQEAGTIADEKVQDLPLDDDGEAAKYLGPEEVEALAQVRSGPACKYRRSLPRRALREQVVERPAYRHRPHFTSKADDEADKPNMVSLRRKGKEFTGYHDDPLKRYFAACLEIRHQKRVIGVPAYFGVARPAADKSTAETTEGQWSSGQVAMLIEQFLRTRT